MRTFARAAPAALLLAGCAGPGAPARPELEALRAEVAALRRENEALSRRVDDLAEQAARAGGKRVDAPVRPAEVPAPVPVAAPAPAPVAPLVPPDLAVVRLDPPAHEASPGRATGREPVGGLPASTARSAAPPSLPTGVPIAEPAPERIAALARPAGRALSAEADAELRAARARRGLEGAHALEDFAARYPHHPSADNALVEAASAYAAAGREEAACALAQRTADEYPAGDAMSAALERLAACEGRRGAPGAERRLLERIVSEHPGTPAAHRARARLAALSAATPSPRQASSRSGP